MILFCDLWSQVEWHVQIEIWHHISYDNGISKDKRKVDRLNLKSGAIMECKSLAKIQLKLYKTMLIVDSSGVFAPNLGAHFKYNHYRIVLKNPLLKFS